MKLRIWDIHYHGFYGGGIRQHEENLFYVERMGIERMLSLDIAGTPDRSARERRCPAEKKREIREYLEKNSDRVSGLIPIDPSQPVESCRKMDEWIANGPCIGIKYYGGNPGGVVCSHPNNDAIIRLAAELNAVIYIHTWMKIGGQPRRPGGDNERGESTPMDVALLAARFPECAADLRPFRRRLGAGRPRRPPSRKRLHRVQRLRPAFGAGRFHRARSRRQPAHLGRPRPLAFVFDRAVESPRRRPDPRPAAAIFGGNLRRLAAPIFRRKGYKL